MKKLKRSKECPSCKKKVGPRTIKCECNYTFLTSKKKIQTGKKCPQCAKDLRPRAKECDNCLYKYPEKKKRGYEEILEWKKLKRDQQFILRKGSKGPFFKGEKGPILMAYRGQFSVRRLEKNGIIAYSPSEGFAFIYMGPNKICEETGIYKRKYRLFKKI